ncbi:MAG: ribosome maturation factor RimM [Bdellovibrionota bacterium]
MTIINKERELSHIGKVIDAHGIKGDIYCLVFSGDSSWISKVKKIKLDTLDFEVKKIKSFKKGFIATLNGIDDRNKAEKLKGAGLWVDSSLFVSKNGESLYLSELLNFNVEDKISGKIGKVTSFSTNSMQDLLVISDSDKDNTKTIEIPFVKEFVIKIDYEKKIIYMNLPEGLLDINEPEIKSNKDD